MNNGFGMSDQILAGEVNQPQRAEVQPIRRARPIPNFQLSGLNQSNYEYLTGMEELPPEQAAVLAQFQNPDPPEEYFNQNVEFPYDMDQQPQYNVRPQPYTQFQQGMNQQAAQLQQFGAARVSQRNMNRNQEEEVFGNENIAPGQAPRREMVPTLTIADFETDPYATLPERIHALMQRFSRIDGNTLVNMRYDLCNLLGLDAVRDLPNSVFLRDDDPSEAHRQSNDGQSQAHRNARNSGTERINITDSELFFAMIRSYRNALAAATRIQTEIANRNGLPNNDDNSGSSSARIVGPQQEVMAPIFGSPLDLPIGQPNEQPVNDVDEADGTPYEENEDSNGSVEMVYDYRDENNEDVIYENCELNNPDSDHTYSAPLPQNGADAPAYPERASAYQEHAPAYQERAPAYQERAEHNISNNNTFQNEIPFFHYPNCRCFDRSLPVPYRCNGSIDSRSTTNTVNVQSNAATRVVIPKLEESNEVLEGTHHSYLGDDEEDEPIQQENEEGDEVLEVMDEDNVANVEITEDSGMETSENTEEDQAPLPPLNKSPAIANDGEIANPTVDESIAVHPLSVNEDPRADPIVPDLGGNAEDREIILYPTDGYTSEEASDFDESEDSTDSEESEDNQGENGNNGNNDDDRNHPFNNQTARRNQPRKRISRPCFLHMVCHAIFESKQKKASKTAIMRFITENYKFQINKRKINNRVSAAIFKLLACNKLKRTAAGGKGLNGSFYLAGHFKYAERIGKERAEKCAPTRGRKKAPRTMDLSNMNSTADDTTAEVSSVRKRAGRKSVAKRGSKKPSEPSAENPPAMNTIPENSTSKDSTTKNAATNSLSNTNSANKGSSASNATVWQLGALPSLPFPLPAGFKQKKTLHPAYHHMIKAAIKEMDDGKCRGIPQAEIITYIKGHYIFKRIDLVERYVLTALKRLVSCGDLAKTAQNCYLTCRKRRVDKNLKKAVDHHFSLLTEENHSCASAADQPAKVSNTTLDPSVPAVQVCNPIVEARQPAVEPTDPTLMLSDVETVAATVSD